MVYPCPQEVLSFRYWLKCINIKQAKCPEDKVSIKIFENTNYQVFEIVIPETQIPGSESVAETLTGKVKFVMIIK